MLDRYCERVGAGLWAEPVNLLSNAAFIIAAWAAFRAYRREPGLRAGQWDLWLLIATVFAVGLGSSLWHLFATPWALRADTLPITLFINLFLLSSLFRVLRTPVWLGAGLFVLYHILNQLIGRALPPDLLNASVYYLPSWLFLAGIATYLGLRRLAGWRHFVIATLLFTVSLVFRTIDQAVCDLFPVGTHFLWHLLNAIMLFLLLRGLFQGAAARTFRTC